jgi:hypothetical protein
MVRNDILLQPYIITSVADPGCLSRIPDPTFLVIPDPGSYIKK